MLKLNLKEKIASVTWLLHQKPEAQVFFLLVALLPTQLSIFFWPDYSVASGIRVDYLAPSIYLTDVLMVALILMTFTKRLVKVNQKQLTTLAIVLIFSLINIYFSKVWQVSAFRWIKVGEYLFLSFFVYSLKDKLVSVLPKALLVGMIYSFVIGLLQIINGSTSGNLFYFLGERSFDINTPGIALANLFGQNYLRAYSVFPHPNVFGGFGVVASALVYIFAKEKRQKQMGLIMGGLIAVISLSRSAIISELILLALIYKSLYKYIATNAKQLVLGLVIISLLLMPISSVIVQSNLQFGLSVDQRIELANYAGRIFSENPLVGVGAGNFIKAISGYLGVGVKLLQPVHNIFLLVLTEYGVVGLTFFVMLLFKLNFKKFSAGALLLLPILATGMVDHYWISLGQPALLFAIVIGILL